MLNVCSDIASHDNYLDSIQPFFKCFFNHQQWDSWLDLLKNYVVFSFIQHNSHKLSDTGFYLQYLRVLKNLINNQRFDSGSRYKGLILTIDRINQHLRDTDENILECLVGLNLDNTHFNPDDDKIERNSLVFTKEQLEEEIYKAELILSDDGFGLSWQFLIEHAEKHEYFNGKISFLLTLSQNNKEAFTDYYKKIEPLFREDNLNLQTYLMQRALLTFGNYFLHKGGNKVTFCKNDKNTFRERSENWLAVLSDPVKLGLVRNLIDDELYNFEEVEASLYAIVERYCKNNPIEEFITAPLVDVDYYKLYIYDWALFQYGTSRLIQLDESSRYAFQLNATNTRGYFHDSICCFIKNMCFSTIDSVKVHATKGWNNSPVLVFRADSYLKLDKWKNKIQFFEYGSPINEFNTIEEAIRFVSLSLKNEYPKILIAE
jgi:hypothetical protein